jgi:peptidoglycan/LPS O-acetylase OafA/YrhL
MVNATARSHWSTSLDHNLIEPPLTSSECVRALADFFNNEPFLAVAAEASSHPSGLASLLAQPWVYAGGGLGSMDECPAQICLAGGVSRDSFTFASICIVSECTASDLAADDFVERLETLAFSASTKITNSMILSQEYVTINQRIAKLNKFLGTGWVCGEFYVDWQIVPTLLYGILALTFIILSFIGTVRKNHQSKKAEDIWEDHPINDEGGEEKKEVIPYLDNHDARSAQGAIRSKPFLDFWDAWDISLHLKRLQQQRPETACLDGLKVGSILWVISGHVMAIQSSSGGGYSNPHEFLPPDGITTTVMGQLLFSSRFAVDTFLCLSGFLVVHVLKRKLPEAPRFSVVLKILVLRILRILPLYAMCLGFWMFVAPHCGSGPFWYQWRGLLEPCRKWWWSNALFMNNFVPWDVPTSYTCFYHSWYLAVDVQLFCLFAPWLVILFRRSHSSARYMTVFWWSVSVAVTAYYSYTKKWSVNTFDGAAVALFDIEGYAKPHVRAQSYLAGMYVAMLPSLGTIRRSAVRDHILLLLSLTGLALVTFITATGAYARRACRNEEWPTVDECGSTWSSLETFLYAAFSRAIWSICVSCIMKLCLEGRGRSLGQCLSWCIWTPLAHLSFGAYLIHPIVIFIWQIGGREKETFRLLTFSMDFVSVTVVSFVAAACAALLVEFPCTAMLQSITRRQKKDDSANSCFKALRPVFNNVELNQYHSYGAVDRVDFDSGNEQRPLL